MKILLNDIIQNSDAPKELKSPALSETFNESTVIINLDKARAINCVGIGNTNARNIRLDFSGGSQLVPVSHTIMSWGLNASAQLGIGNQNSPIINQAQAGTLQDIRFIECGTLHSVAIRNDGTLWTWGGNGNGRTGLGTSSGYASNPTRVGTASNWVMVSTDNNHTMAINELGQLWGWGNNGNGRIGDGTTTQRNSPVRVGTDSDWSIVAAGNQHTLAIKNNGTLWACGINTNGRTGLGTEDATNTMTPTQVGTDTDWLAIQTANNHTIALKTNGTLWSWGSNANGRTGLGISSGNTLVPTQIGSDNDWHSITVGQQHNFAIKNNGTLWAWGNSTNGRTGLGMATGNTVIPMSVGTDNDWSSISAGEFHTMMLKNDGTLWACGNNADGQLGDGAITENVMAPAQIGNSLWHSISAGRQYTQGIMTGIINNADVSLGIEFDQTGLYCLERTINASQIIVTLSGASPFIGRFAAGLAINIPTSVRKEPAYCSTATPRMTLSGQVIFGAGGHNYRMISLDSRYKIDGFIMNELEEGYKYIAMNYPFFIDLTAESYKLPFDKLYAIDTNQQRMSFESGVRKFLYSRRWEFKECF